LIVSYAGSGTLSTQHKVQYKEAMVHSSHGALLVKL